jgi:hypothetical protein
VTVSIYFDKSASKFHARIYHKGVYHHVGRYSTHDEAVAKAQAAVEKRQSTRKKSGYESASYYEQLKQRTAGRMLR